MKDYENARSHYEKAVLLAPENPIYHQNFALLLEEHLKVGFRSSPYPFVAVSIRNV